MKNLDEIFGNIAFCDYTTRAALKKKADFIREYKSRTIAFTQTKDREGKTWYRIKIYETDGKGLFGICATRNYCNTDCEAVRMGYRWAKENIDKLEK